MTIGNHCCGTGLAAPRSRLWFLLPLAGVALLDGCGHADRTFAGAEAGGPGVGGSSGAGVDEGSGGAAGETGSGGLGADSGGNRSGAAADGPTAGAAGSTGGTAGSTAGVAGSTGGNAGSTGGTADSTGGSAGSTGGTVGSTGGTAGSTGGTAGSTGGTGGSGDCAAGERDCQGTCISADACCTNADCAGGQLCVEHACTCDSATKLCGTECIPESACCTNADCSTTGAICTNGACGCPDGTHVCDGVCSDDASVDTCGTSCEPCQAPIGGTVTCEGVCVPACPSGQQVCAGECIADTVVCGGCGTGFHDCSGICVANDSVSGCGPTSCEPCPTPDFGVATCDGTSCGISCNTDYKECEGACIPVDGCCDTSECQAGASCVLNACTCDDDRMLCDDGSCVLRTGCCDVDDCPNSEAWRCSANVCECTTGHAGPNCSLIFQPVPRLPTHDSGCYAEAISGNGTTIVGYCVDSDYQNYDRAYRSVNGTTTALDDSGLGSAAYGVNSDGTTIVGYSYEAPITGVSAIEPAAWHSTIFTIYPSAIGQNASQNDSEAVELKDVSADGIILVGMTYRLCYYWDRNMTGTDPYFGPDPVNLGITLMGGGVTAVSDDGQKIVVWTENPSSGNVLRVYALDGTYTTVQNSSTTGTLDGISGDGTTVVGSSGGVAVVWPNITANPTSLGVPGTTKAASGDASIVVGEADFGSGLEAFVSDGTTTVSLTDALVDAGADLSGWNLDIATDVSSDGSIIVGNGTNPSGVVQGWRVHLSGTGILGF